VRKKDWLISIYIYLDGEDAEGHQRKGSFSKENGNRRWQRVDLLREEPRVRLLY
jgi:hypothetical protein